MNIYDDSVGLLYHGYVFPYVGAHGAGATANKFWPAPGDSDWGLNSLQDYKDFFTLPNNERYYEKIIGPIHFFFLSTRHEQTADNEPDGYLANSTEGKWLQAKLLLSTAPWKVVVMFDAPYSSVLPKTAVRWPFRSWGAHMVISGSVRNYERFDIAGLVAINNGLGGNGPIEPAGTLVDSITVSAAGVNDVFGLWTMQKTLNGKPQYIHHATKQPLLWGPIGGDPTSQWGMFSITAGGLAYYSYEDVSSPDLVTTWVATAPFTDPLPTVSVASHAVPGVNYSAGFGAGRLTATTTTLLYEFVNLAGEVVDSVQLTK